MRQTHTSGAFSHGVDWMKITIIAVGTRGDVQPAIALGQALKQRGHTVRLAASADFCDWIEQYGLETAESTVNIQQLMESEGGVAWVERGYNPVVQIRLMKKLLDQYGWAMAWDAWQACQGAEAIISSFTSDTYVTAIAEKLSIPQMSMLLQPAVIATRDGRSIFNTPLPNRLSLFNRWFSRAFIEPAPWQMLGEVATRLRQELKLPPQSARENKAVRQQLLMLQAYSAHVVPHPVDWPPNVHTTGYWFLDEQPDWQPSTALHDFLAAGPPPVYIGFGSMTGSAPKRTTRLILDALAISGQRAIVSSGWAGLGQDQLPESIFQIEAVPHNWLFPRMAAVVHHGGAGTTAAGLRAGIPSLIIPHFADQPYWGQRIYALGVGPKPLPRHKLTAQKLAQGLQMAVSDSLMKQRAATLGGKIRAETGVVQAVDLIEKHILDG